MYAISWIVLLFAIFVFMYGFARILHFFPSFYPLKEEDVVYSKWLRPIGVPTSMLLFIEKVRLCFDRETLLETLAYVLGKVPT